MPNFAVSDHTRRPPAITLTLDRFHAAELAAQAGHIQVPFNEFSLPVHLAPLSFTNSTNKTEFVQSV
jgi:hypothetical protein